MVKRGKRIRKMTEASGYKGNRIKGCMLIDADFMEFTRVGRRLVPRKGEGRERDHGHHSGDVGRGRWVEVKMKLGCGLKMNCS